MRVLMPLPDQDFDVTEASVPRRILTDAGHEVILATELGGAAPAADARLLSGVLFGQLGAAAEPRAFYQRTAYLLTAWRLGRYYRTYPAYVEDEVTASLDDPDQLEPGPRAYSRPGRAVDDVPAFVVQDGNYLSARWPGDAYLFGKRFLTILEASAEPVFHQIETSTP